MSLIYKERKNGLINSTNNMAQCNLFDVDNSVILKFPADDL